MWNSNMKIKRIFLSFMCLVALAFSVHAGVYTIESVPDPKQQGQQFYVSNPDTVLSLAAEELINEDLHQLYKETGVEMAVVAVRNFDEDEYPSAYNFALSLFNYWGIGGADSNTGVLLLLVLDTRDIRIITGDGIAGILTDAKCGDFLDAHLEVLGNNDFDTGIAAICQDIHEYLLDDNRRSELMLGWSPQDTDSSNGGLIYFAFAFLALVVLALLSYKVLDGKPGEPVSEIQFRASELTTATGCLTLIFPLPLLFYYIYYRIALKHVKPKPLICKQCGQTMLLLPAADPARQLTKEQMQEEAYQVRTFDMWRCPQCNALDMVKGHGKKFYHYSDCPSCHTHLMELVSTTTTRQPTYYSRGEKVNSYLCKCCGHTKSETEFIPMLTRSSSSSSSGGRSSGSWGGGHSSGGGAGRKF